MSSSRLDASTPALHAHSPEVSVVPHRQSFRPRRRNSRLAVLAPFGVIVAALIFAAPAFGFSGHTLATEFSGTGTNSLSAPSAVAVDDTSHDVYVVDSGHLRIEKFTSSGEFIFMFGEDVDQTTGANVCTAASHDVCQAGTRGTSPGAFSSSQLRVAVDNSPGGEGNVYVDDPGDDTVSKFDSAGDLLAGWGNGGQLDGSSVAQGSFAGSPTTGNGILGIAVDKSGTLYVAAGDEQFFRFSPDGTFLSQFAAHGVEPTADGIALNASDEIYLVDSHRSVVKLSPSGALIGRVIVASRQEGQPLGVAVDVETGDLFVSRFHEVELFPASCEPTPTGTCSSVETLANPINTPQGIAVDSATDSLYLADSLRQSVLVYNAVPLLTTASAAPLTPTSERLEAHIDPLAGSGPVTSCRFEYGESASYGSGPLACSPAPSPGSPFTAPTDVVGTPDLTGLSAGSTYHFRVVVENGEGEKPGPDQTFTTFPAQPQVGSESATEVAADAALITVKIDPGGGGAIYHTNFEVEYLPQAQLEQNEANGEPEFAGATQSQALDAGSGHGFEPHQASLGALTPSTIYAYRVAATNATGSALGTTKTFVTLPSGATGSEGCPNAHVRQQTGTAQLLDCRAYELVSAANSGGYDVESSLVPGQTPFGSYPDASNRVLYGIHGGGLPGTGSPTNRGVDPYLATRGENGWSTSYVGIPADGTPSTVPFSSTLLEADAGLGAFAFGGAEICSPCFSGPTTTEVGNPIRKPAGELVQGMAGSIAQPAAVPAGIVGRHLSADGTHFIFGSESRFQPDGNEGEVSIYDRNLLTDETNVVSKTPAAATMTGPGIAALDVSADGTRVLLGQLVSESKGAKYWHLYMNVGDAAQTIDLTPGATHGVLYDGMTSDGAKVFFSTVDPLTGDDEDHSADIYRADVSSTASTLTRISTGIEGSGNTDSCNPVANSAHPHWNTTGAEANCGVVAVGGGGGVASASGTIYFLSPEKLDGSANGTQNAPNLYVAVAGSAPRYITTLESVLTGPQPPLEGRSLLGEFGSFTAATGLAVDHSNGDVYVMDAGSNSVEKFDSAGNLITTFGDATPSPDGRLTGAQTPAGGFEEFAPYPTELAVDQASGDLYVPDVFHSVVDKFSPSGEYLSQVSVNFASGVAVDPTSGNVYAASLFGSIDVFEASGTALTSFPVSGNPGGVAVAPSGAVYVTNGSEANVYKPNGEFERQLDSRPSQSLTVDPSNEDVYVNEGERITQFDAAGNELATVGASTLSGSDGVAIDPGGNLYATNGSRVATFGPVGLLPSSAIDNPLVLDSVGAPSTRNTADFQTTPSGEFAAFPSTLALAGSGEETNGHTVIYRYGAVDERLSCAACTTSGAPSAGDATLAPDGQSLTDQGQVFFTSADHLASADTDKKKDVYEWEPQGTGNCQAASASFSQASASCLSLVSAGTSTFDSGLLGASASGRDVFFFTRDSLAPQDTNGATMKIYDAREGGGFPFTLEAVQCQASDECHGAASPAPGPPAIGSVAGKPGNSTSTKKCKSDSRRKHGRCVRKSKHRRGRRPKQTKSNRGGTK